MQYVKFIMDRTFYNITKTSFYILYNIKKFIYVNYI